jgi:hypothetical protein
MLVLGAGRSCRRDNVMLPVQQFVNEVAGF